MYVGAVCQCIPMCGHMDRGTCVSVCLWSLGFYVGTRFWVYKLWASLFPYKSFVH